jgi:hypothetical protein
MDLLVPFAFRNSFKWVLRCITNFGKRALGPVYNHGLDPDSQPREVLIQG